MLRKYLYIDEKFINDAFATIMGYDYDEKSIEYEDTQSISESEDKTETKSITSKSNTTISASLPISSKLQKVIDFLCKENGGELPFWESVSANESSKLCREYFFEGQFNIEFTKIERWGNLASGVQRLDSLFETHKTDNVKAITKLQQLAKQERERGLPSIFSFVNNSTLKCYAYLDESYIRINKIDLQTEATVLCKVVRVIKQGTSICLTDLSEYMNTAFPDTKEGKKKKIAAIKSGQLKKIKDLEDRVEGPAIEVLPIAIYK